MDKLAGLFIGICWDDFQVNEVLIRLKITRIQMSSGYSFCSPGKI